MPPGGVLSPRAMVGTPSNHRLAGIRATHHTRGCWFPRSRGSVPAVAHAWVVHSMECSHSMAVRWLANVPPMPWRSPESDGQERRVASVQIAARHDAWSHAQRHTALSRQGMWALVGRVLGPIPDGGRATRRDCTPAAGADRLAGHVPGGWWGTAGVTGLARHGL